MASCRARSICRTPLALPARTCPRPAPSRPCSGPSGRAHTRAPSPDPASAFFSCAYIGGPTACSRPPCAGRRAQTGGCIAGRSRRESRRARSVSRLQSRRIRLRYGRSRQVSRRRMRWFVEWVFAGTLPGQRGAALCPLCCGSGSPRLCARRQRTFGLRRAMLGMEVASSWQPSQAQWPSSVAFACLCLAFVTAVATRNRACAFEG